MRYFYFNVTKFSAKEVGWVPTPWIRHWILETGKYCTELQATTRVFHIGHSNILFHWSRTIIVHVGHSKTTVISQMISKCFSYGRSLKRFTGPTLLLENHWHARHFSRTISYCLTAVLVAWIFAFPWLSDLDTRVRNLMLVQDYHRETPLYKVINYISIRCIVQFPNTCIHAQILWSWY